MWSGISSVGSATTRSGNNGKSCSRATCRAYVCPAYGGSGGPARRDDQVVEDRRREPRLEQGAVDGLQGDVAAEGVLAPQPRDAVRLGGRLERPVGPAEPVRE